MPWPPPIGKPWRPICGIACSKHPAKLDSLVTAVRQVNAGRVGVSPPYPDLEHTANALRLAHIALAASCPGLVTLFDTAPLAHNRGQRIPSHATGGRRRVPVLLELRPDDRDTLLETLEAWRDNNGSATVAGSKLFCYPNTVRHRLRRIEALTGRSLTDPRAIAELCLALEAVRVRPELLTTQNPAARALRGC
jgi:hypothetical protein